jgi:ketosteroid isomerase-like protein
MTQGDEEQIRALIRRWAEAVHRGDLNRVLEDHADDIVMFDVPPPYEGVRGIDAYRETWPPFFVWQERGPRSRSCRWTSPRVRTSPTLTPPALRN